MVKISVIIPIYNTAKYLNACIDSVLNQSLFDIEVICVNDGSTDSSLMVLEDYMLKDERVRIISQENSGLATSRNVGMDNSTGEYILFLDSDDYIEENCLMDIYNIASAKSLDLLMFKIINFNDETYEKSTHRYFEMDFLKDRVGEEIFDWFDVKDVMFDISVTAPGKLFRREVISDIRFPDGLIFEDNPFFIKTMLNCKRVYFYDKHLYNRRFRKNSITNSYFDKFSDCIDVYEIITDFLKSTDKYSYLESQLFNRKYKDIYHRFSMVEDEEYKKVFFKKIKQSLLKDEMAFWEEPASIITDKRSLAIYNSALSSKTPEEFVLSVKNYDLQTANRRLKRELDTYKSSGSLKNIASSLRNYFKS